MAMTLKNTKENIQMLKRQGYNKSSVSKPNGMYKCLRYDTKRMVYWFSSDRYYYKQNCDAYFNTHTIIIC